MSVVAQSPYKPPACPDAEARIVRLMRKLLREGQGEIVRLHFRIDRVGQEYTTGTFETAHVISDNRSSR